MELALYHPEYGYYARSVRQVGRRGDFFTSVSTGPLFGRLLARRFLSEWKNLGSPAAWRVIESGAHDGTLAHDILTELRTLDPSAFSALRYAIPEPLPLLQSAQKATLAAFANVDFLTSPGPLASAPLPGIAFGNEVLDALPFHIIQWDGSRWRELHAGLENDRFIWCDGGSPAHQPPIDTSALPPGYRTEIRGTHAAFLSPLLAALGRGLLLWIDYGYPEEDYYHPGRTTGTLRTFSRHQAAEDPLSSPGEIDITAHVDFTSVIRDAGKLGCHPSKLQSQGTWLTHLAAPLLLQMDGNPDPSLLRQFQTLTHPAHLGARFHVLELTFP